MYSKMQGRGAIGGQNSWIIETLELNDVMVVDIFGKVKDGTVVGDNHEQALSRLKSQEVRRQGHRFFDGSDGQRITVISGGGM